MVSKDAASPQTVSQEITTTRVFDTLELRDMATFDDALTALGKQNVVLREASDHIGDGFELLDEDDKKQLIGVMFVILEASESSGDYGKTFVSLRIMTKDGRKVILNDGSTGIRDQIVNDVLPRYGNAAGFVISHGLRVSTYMFCDNCKNVDKTGTQACTKCGASPLKPAATYYLDTSK